jgi:hypothetical protein
MAQKHGGPIQQPGDILPAKFEVECDVHAFAAKLQALYDYNGKRDMKVVLLLPQGRGQRLQQLLDGLGQRVLPVQQLLFETR